MIICIIILLQGTILFNFLNRCFYCDFIRKPNRTLIVGGFVVDTAVIGTAAAAIATATNLRLRFGLHATNDTRGAIRFTIRPAIVNRLEIAR
ncbi:MAG: hypothetical protein Hyperionvirus6_67 [Hyperionvirus sp.]|uniref:Uncharacterized protein n=1 Tax=Hyperionvirus sp. TaxID=2487770 RepID=A0A3G5A7Z1_9VIRU|nr:MAG: hypothetical protein Hyperionvirus6_67 [Hyperionvirus sp.]